MKAIPLLLFSTSLALNKTLVAAVILNAGTTYTQNFDSMGDTTTLPDDWVITFDDAFTNPNFAHLDAQSSVNYLASREPYNTSLEPGTYNFSSFTDRRDRAVGVLPDLTNFLDISSILILSLNINDPSITRIEISFSAETYYVGNSSNDVILGLWSSSGDPTNWNAKGYAWDNSAEEGYHFDSPTSITSTATIESDEFSLGDLYLVFQFNGGGPSGVALDDVSVSAISEPTISLSYIADSQQLSISFTGVIQESSDLGVTDPWSDIEPQPTSPWTFIPADDKMFYRIKP